MSKTLLVLVAALAVTGCASQSGNMMVGTGQSYLSIGEQREAARTVKVFSDLPAGATVLGPVDASRCHRNTLEAAPSDDVLLTDLKVAAYARGADGIVGVTTTKESGLLKNCWYIITAKANMVRVAN